MTKARFSAAFALAGSLAASAPSYAFASGPYPEAMKADLDLSYVPTCDLCHHDSHAAAPSADTLFAHSMIARGLVGSDERSLSTALDVMRQQDVDSDGDGAIDVDELWWGGNPNVADGPISTPEASAEPTYGCTYTVGRVATPDRFGRQVCLVFLFGVGLFARFRSRARARSRQEPQ